MRNNGRGSVVPPGRRGRREKKEPFLFGFPGHTYHDTTREYHCADGDVIVLGAAAGTPVDAVIWQDAYDECEIALCANRAKAPHEVWVLESLEAPRCRQHASWTRPFDLLSTYKLKEGAYQRSYAWHFGPSMLDAMRKPWVEKGSVEAPVMWTATNCDSRSGREYLVAELMRYIKVSSYGKCLRTNETKYSYHYERDGRGLEPGDMAGGIPNALARNHLFYLALENSNCEDYVTEKLWKTFRAGLVPIVDGPDDYEPFLPANKSVIRADQFPSIAALAAYLDYLSHNRTAYLEYMPWRGTPSNGTGAFQFRPSFLQLLQSDATGGGDYLCNLKTRVDQLRAAPSSRSSLRADVCRRHGKWMPWYAFLWRHIVKTPWELRTFYSNMALYIAWVLLLFCIVFVLLWSKRRRQSSTIAKEN